VKIKQVQLKENAMLPGDRAYKMLNRILGCSIVICGGAGNDASYDITAKGGRGFQSRHLLYEFFHDSFLKQFLDFMKSLTQHSVIEFHPCIRY